MKFQRVTLVLLLLLTALLQPLLADDLKKIAQSGMKWLSIPIGARGAALGNAYSAVSNDASAAFWNPAGLALTEGGHLFLARNQWIADINLNAGAVSYELQGWGVFALTVAAVDWGTLHGTRRADNEQGFVETGEFSPDNFAVGLAYARQITDKFSIGGHVRYLHENLGSNRDGGFSDFTTFTAETNIASFDFGTLYYTGYRDLRVAMSFQNFSQEVRYREEHFSLPLTFKFGVAMGVSQFFTDASDHDLTLSLDAVHPRDYTERLHVGLEYSFNDLLFLRGGYKANYDEEDLTFGAGLNYGYENWALGLNYSYTQFENFDAVQMFSFDFQF